MQTGVLQQVFINDRRQVLVVSQVLSEDHECHRNVGNRNRCDVGGINLLEALECLNEGELGNCKNLQICKSGEVDNLQGIDTGNCADNGEDGSHNVAYQNTQHEGDQLHHLLAVNREQNDGNQGHQAANQSHIGAAAGNTTGGQVAHSIACQAHTDDGHSGSDNSSGHQLVNPLNTGKLNHQSDDYIHQTCKHSAQQDTGKTGRAGSSACKGGAHRAQESEG